MPCINATAAPSPTKFWKPKRSRHCRRNNRKTVQKGVPMKFVAQRAAQCLQPRLENGSPSPFEMGEGGVREDAPRRSFVSEIFRNSQPFAPSYSTRHSSPTMVFARCSRSNPAAPAVRPSPRGEGRVRGTGIEINPALLARSPGSSQSNIQSGGAQ
jgi:hypothetical protein